MPAEIVTGEFCASYYGTYEVPSSSGGDPYIVTLGGTQAHCTCKAFQYFKGEESDRSCKHISQVWKEACLWNCQWFDGNEPVKMRPKSIDCPSLIPSMKCDKCKGPIAAVKIAV